MATSISNNTSDRRHRPPDSDDRGFTRAARSFPRFPSGVAGRIP
jgi:hypothetical protein